MNRRADMPAVARATQGLPHNGRYRVCTVVGTRPEAIKLAPVILELERHKDSVQTVVVATAKHREMLAQALDVFGITPHVDLALVAPRNVLADFTARALTALSACFTELRPDVVLLQGDNTTVLAGSLAAHYLGIPVCHIEAGVRSESVRNPFPEELNRRLATVVSDLHFAPTARARENLLREGVPDDRIILTGNTVVDAVRLMPRKAVFSESALNQIPWGKRRVVLVTLHRRENIGEPIAQACRAILELVSMHADLHIVFPLHPNPRVRDAVVDELGDVPRIELMEPLNYSDLIEVMRRSDFAITDSAGIQEEAASLQKPVLVLRKNTDRPEVIGAGFGRVVPAQTLAMVEAATLLLDDDRELARMSEGDNPFGDGLASQRIVRALLSRAPRQAGGSPVAEGPALLPPLRAVER